MGETFDLGDTVQLNAGGPVMVVDNIGKHMAGSTRDEALCSWFETVKGKRQRMQDWFELHSIKKVNPDVESGFYPGSSIMG
jgi:uncharacterized protein YodC (DUF2158 family)